VSASATGRATACMATMASKQETNSLSANLDRYTVSPLGPMLF
jgi:hypothetical protein